MEIDEITPLLEEAASDEDKPQESEEVQDELRWFREELHQRESLPWHKRPSISILAVIMFVFGIFVTIGVPTTNKLLIDQICISNGFITQEDGTCESLEPQELYSHYKSWSVIAKYTTCSLVAGKVGQYSDIYGRKKIFVLMSVIMLISECIRMFILAPGKSFSFWGTILADIIVSLDGGGMTGFGRISDSYISDIESAEGRIGAMSVVAGCIWAGTFFGPFISSLLLKWGYSEFSVLKVSVAFGFVYLLFTSLVLPESRSKMERVRSRNQLQDLYNQQEQSFLDKINVLKPMKIIFVTDPRKKKVVYPLIFFVTLTVVAGAADGVIFQYVAFKLHISASEIGIAGMISGALSFVSLIFLTPFLVKYLNSIFQPQEKKLDMIDLSFMSIFAMSILIGSLMQCAMTSMSVYFMFTAVGAIGMMGELAVYSAIVKYFDRRNSGQVYGAMGSYQNMVALVLLPTFLYIYKVTYIRWTTFIFFVNASVQFSLIPLFFWLRHVIVSESVDEIESVVSG